MAAVRLAETVVAVLHSVEAAIAVHLAEAMAAVHLAEAVVAVLHSVEATAVVHLVEAAVAVHSAEAAAAVLSAEVTAAAEAARSEDIVKMRTSAFIIRWTSRIVHWA